MRVNLGLRERVDLSEHSYQVDKGFRLLVSIARLRGTPYGVFRRSELSSNLCV